MGNSYTADIEDIYYGPPAPEFRAAEHPLLTFNMFYPQESVAGPMPAGGWPVVCFSNLTGFISVNKLTTVGDAQVIQQAILDRGMALAYCNLPVARGQTTNPASNTESYSTTLSANFLAASTFLPVADNIGFKGGGGEVVINEGQANEEIVQFSGKSPGFLTGLTRDNPQDHFFDDSEPVTETTNLSLLQWGPAYRGNGCMVQANGNTEEWPGPFPSGYDTDHPTRPHPWLDPEWTNSSKAAMWLVQYLRYNGIGAPGPQSTKLNIHPGRIGAFGQSAAAISFVWPGYQPNRAGYTGMGTSGMGAMSTRLQAGAFRQCTTYWLAFNELGAPDGPVGYMFARRAFSSGNNDYDTPCVNMGEADHDPGDPNTPAGEAAWAVRGSCGADFFGKAEAEVPGITALNNAFPAFWSSEEDMSATALATPNRYIGSANNFNESRPHTMYHGYRAKSVWPDGVYLVAEDAGSVDPDPVSGGGVAEDEQIFTGVNDVYIAAASFLQTNLQLKVPVEEQVIQKIEVLLAAITHANGWDTDVRDVFRFESMPEDLLDSPVVMVDALGTDSDDKFEADVIYKKLNLRMTLFLRGWELQQERVSRFLADVEKAMYADHRLGDDVGVVTLHLQRAERLLFDNNTHQWAAGEMDWQIEFRHRIGDPFTVHPYDT